MQPDHAEELTRYALERRDAIGVGTPYLHPRRLHPRPNPLTSRLEVSVVRSTGMDEDRVWQICAQYLDPKLHRPAAGRGVGPGASVYQVGLELDPDGQPYPEHANIVGWPNSAGSDDADRKARCMEIAQRLSLHFRFEARPPR